MKARVKASGEIVEVEQLTRTTAICPANGKIYHKSQLDLDPPYPEATISGWVARDDWDNVYIYHSKPKQRTKEFCDTGEYFTDWVCDTKYPDGKRYYVIDKDFFPDLTPESEPQKIRIQITPME